MPDVEDASSEVNQSESARPNYRGLGILGVLIFLAIVLVVSFELVYAGKVYPGVSANGVYLGGLSKAEASVKLTKATEIYKSALLPVTYGSTTVRIPLNQVALSYDNAKAAQAAIDFGRQGSLIDKLHAQLRALVGRTTPVTTVSYDRTHLDPFILQASNDIDTAVANASLSFNDNHSQVAPSQTGKRVDVGRLAIAIDDRLGQTSVDSVAAPLYDLEPSISTSALASVAHQADSFVSAPITVSVNGNGKTIDQATIISWLTATAVTPKSTYLPDFYPNAVPASAKITLDSGAIAAYVAAIAKKTDVSGQNAALTIDNNVATIFQPSRDGVKLDQDDAIKQITDAITIDGAKRDLTLKVAVSKPAVTEESLNNLGINELISSATTYFPGSPYARLTNIRVGATRFNGVLLAPDEQFSFGQILGDVGPEQGYLPGLVILNNHEEKQYGGGLCQVASTAYRAALLAGLPINERYNHSFAVNQFYTWPYGVPGVDATIYYPQVDLKFTNDTGHYILIQTHMAGSKLTFDFYGTKVKSGQIRGPYFISGSLDATQPSTTIFYRDILDLAGNVIKTDSVTTHYQSSLDFPVQD